ncbi:hypothetical protein BKA65DRAFT_165382 [Rhexocercosporidium sp. MPI-PUGE-AT-0058]|nr:hypothetical protein BKA65DRAFT_165382 [Rhexocercosporidium sp. MPI-PUGE-AT-0058]
MQDSAGWRPQLRGGGSGGKDQEDEEILLADRRSSDSVRSLRDATRNWGGSCTASELGEDGIEKEGDDGDGSEIGDGVPKRGLSRSTKGTIWVVLMTMSTLVGRRLLRGGFPYPFFLVLLIQLIAWILIAFLALLIQLRKLSTKATKSQEASEGHSWVVAIFIISRTLLASLVSGVAALCGALALLHTPNLPVLAMLPIVTYVFDSFFFRAAYVLHLFPRDQSTSVRKVYKVIFVLAFSIPPIVFDYRLNIRSLLIALAGFALLSLSKVISKTGPTLEMKGNGFARWDTPLHFYLLQGIAPIFISWIAATKYENVIAAHHAFSTWSWGYIVLYLAPGVLLQQLFVVSMNSAHPFISQVHVGGALEEPTETGTDAIASTLQAGFWTVVIGVLGQEKNFVDWIQVIAFTLIYIVGVGPKHIGYYPPRLMNLFFRALRRRQLKLHPVPWQFAFFLATTTAVFTIVISCNVMFWVDTVAYNHNLKTWLGPKTFNLDTMYRPPKLRSFDIIIAHSEGDPISTISDLISTFTTHHFIRNLNPSITIYSKDPTLNISTSSAESLKGEFEGDLSIQALRNSGGVPATFLHHILYSWSFMPVQTLFLSTATTNALTLPLHKNRVSDYFIPMGFPLPDALPKSGFLNLGEQETCLCGQCFDSLGWEDSFHLVPSMWAAARPGSPTCESALLTYGNNFIASAARIRGTKKDVWQMLYDGLVDENLENAWAHKKEKMPLMLPGEEGKGRFRKGAVFGEKDSLEKPYLGLTVERLWGMLLQCSTPEIAWGCPALEVGWRIGGRREDCGCTE